MEKTAIHAGSPVPGAPYSPGIAYEDLIFVSGQVPMNPETKEVIRDNFEAATEQCILNVERILKAAGSDLEHVLKAVVFLTDMENFSRMNAVYARYFGDVKPARSCVQVAGLPLGVEVEIEVIAVKS